MNILKFLVAALTGEFTRFYAVANTLSTLVTNSDASPPVMNQALVDGGRVRERVGTVEIAAADDDTSVYRMMRVRSSDRISELLVHNDAITGGTDFDLGVYDPASRGGAVVDINCFADAVDLSSAQAGVNITFEGGDVANIAKPLWEILGLSSDPELEYDVCFTGVTVGSGAGTVSLQARYSDGT